MVEGKLGDLAHFSLIILVKDTARWLIRFFSDLYESSAHYVILHQRARHASVNVNGALRALRLSKPYVYNSQKIARHRLSST